VAEAVRLELEGRLGEALDRYRAALTSEPELLKDEALAQPLTVLVLSKAAHLSIDLGLGEEAWDLGGRLIGAGTPAASEAGTLVRLRILRIQGRPGDGLDLWAQHQKNFPQAVPRPGTLAEVRRLRADAGRSTASLDAALRKAGGPPLWAQTGAWTLVPGPAEALGVAVQPTVRLQVGAFKDWGNALTLIDMMREKGWSPLTEVRTLAGGEKLHVVSVLSRQPEADRARLADQGLTP